MAYRIENNQLTGEPEIVIDGWENGISDSPEFGISDMRNINNDSIPGIALCNYKLKTVTQAPLSVAFTVDVANNLITLTTGTFTANCTVKFTNLTGTTGLTGWATTDSTSNIYFAVFQSSTTAKIYSGFNTLSGVNTQVTLGAGGGTVTTINMGVPTFYTIDTYRQAGSAGGGYFVLDDNGRVWVNDSNNFYYLVGNTLTNANGQGIVFWKNYLFVFRQTKIDVYDAYGAEASPYTWSNDWAGVSMTDISITSGHNNHYAKWCQDDILYFCNGTKIGSISEKSGQTFKASNNATYNTPTMSALKLPTSEVANYLEEQVVYLIIGTLTSNLLYPWDRTSTSFTVPIPMPEVGCYKMLNINRLLYILAGQRGNVYYTNGSTVTLFKTLPKQPAKTPYPLWTWGGIMSLNNNLCFGASEKATGTASNAGGCWAITLAIGQLLNTIAGAIRYKGKPSAGFHNTTVLMPFLNGLQYYAAWNNGTNGGIDYLDFTTPTFYTNYESYIETDIIPVGTSLQGKTFNTIEYKLDTPLVNGEKIRISMTSDLNTSYTQVLENIATATYLPIDGSSTSIPVQYTKWIQLKVELQSLSGGSFVRLRELRIR